MMEPFNPLEAGMPPQTAAPGTHPGRHLTGVRRMVATTLLSVGMIAIGGVAIVNAASPAPSASGAPSTSTPATGTPAPGSSAHPGRGSSTSPGDCPNMDNGTTAPAG